MCGDLIDTKPMPPAFGAKGIFLVALVKKRFESGDMVEKGGGIVVCYAEANRMTAPDKIEAFGVEGIWFGGGHGGSPYASGGRVNWQ